MSDARDGRQRLMNAAALALVAAGVAIYGYAFWRMGQVAGGGTLDLAAASSRRQMNLDQYYSLRDLSRVGIGVTLAGVAAVVAAAIRHSRRARRLRDHGLQDAS